MAHVQPGRERVVRAFPYGKWGFNLPALAKEYRESLPSPCIHLADFLDAHVAETIAAEFPSSAAAGWIHYEHRNEKKLGMTRRDLFPPGLGAVVDELNSPGFVNWVSQLTGIPGLIADPNLEGGGLHQSGRGGFLNIHADFTAHYYRKHWRRRVNLVLYLTPGWREEWGGALEFWPRSMSGCAVKYPPLFNHALIFNTDERSLHGFPVPLQCPERVTRNSLALYYYTVERNLRPVSRPTHYRARPEDGLGKSTLIWLDQQAVNLYWKAKARFRFSDDFASTFLSFVSRRK